MDFFLPVAQVQVSVSIILILSLGAFKIIKGEPSEEKAKKIQELIDLNQDNMIAANKRAIDQIKNGKK